MVAAVAYADVIPVSVSDVPAGTLGVYQPTNSIKIYKESENNSKVIYQKTWDYSTVSAQGYSDSMFAILQDDKELAFLYATDMDENFVEVIYNKEQNFKGWVNKEDEFQFLPWINFYNMYGRKYGLKVLSGAPQFVYDLHTRSEKNSQVISRINRPKMINLTAIQGNWALVTVSDIDGASKTGYIQWRGDDGQLYLFPKMD